MIVYCCTLSNSHSLDIYIWNPANRSWRSLYYNMWRDKMRKLIFRRTEIPIGYLTSSSSHVREFSSYYSRSYSLSLLFESPFILKQNQVTSAEPSLKYRAVEFINITNGCFTSLRFSKDAAVSLSSLVSSLVMWPGNEKLDCPFSFLFPSDFYIQ